MDGPMLGERVTEPERLQRLRELVVSCADAEMRLQPGEPFPFATPSFLRRGDVQQLRRVPCPSPPSIVPFTL